MKLPKIYSDSYELSLELLRRTKQFPKHYRPTVGRRLEENALDLSLAVRKMLLLPKRDGGAKNTHLKSASSCVDELKLLIQLCKDLEILGGGAFGILSEKLSLVGVQIGGLLRN